MISDFYFEFDVKLYHPTSRIEIRANKGLLVYVILGELGSLVNWNQLEFYNSKLHLNHNCSILI